MNIGQAAAKSGLPVKTLRYYEDIGLIMPQRCVGNDYRDYSVVDVDHLRFLQRARAVGFSVEVCRVLLNVFRNEENRTAEVKHDLRKKIVHVENQLQELMAFKNTLTEMVNTCDGDDVVAETTEIITSPRSSRMSFTLVDTQ